MTHHLPTLHSRYWLPALLLNAVSPSAHALNYSSGILNFTYGGQALWGEEGLGVSSKKFVGLTLDEAEKQSIGDISGSKDTIVGDTRTGFEVVGSIGPGKVGMNIGMRVGSGSLAVQFPLTVTLGLPDAAVQSGSYVSLGGSYKVDGAHVNLASSFSNASGYEDVVYKMPASLSAKACFIGAGCTSGEANAGLTIDPFEILSYNRDGQGKINAWGTTSLINFNKPFSVTIGQGIPGVVSAGTELGSVTVYTPDLTTQSKTLLPGNIMISGGSTKLMDVDLDLATLINAELLIPPPNAMVKLGSAEASIAAYKLDAVTHLGISQLLNFDPTVQVKLAFDHMVSVTENLAGLGFEVKYTKDQITASLDELANMKFKFDADTKITPTFMLGNTIHNLTTLDLDMDLKLKLLQAGVDFGVGPSYDFNGFTQHLTSADLGSWALVNKSFNVDMGSFTGQSFVIDVAGSNAIPIVWEGLSNSKLLGNAGNWQNGLKPADGETLLFKNHGSLTVAENDYLKQIDGITFMQGSSALTLQGFAVGNSGGIVNESNSAQTVTLAQTLTANQLWDGGSAGLTVSGKLDVADKSLLLRNTQLQQSNQFILGKTGVADLRVTDSSRLQADSLLLGEKAGSAGKLVLSNGSLAEFSHDASDGSGTAVIRIETGSQINIANNLNLANAARVESSLEINGNGSAVSVGHASKLADLGRLYLHVLNGGQFNTHDSRLSVGTSGESMVTLAGKGSTWNALGDLNAGGAGNTSIKVAGGASLNVGSGTSPKRLNLGTGNGQSVLEVGDGGQVTVHGDLSIGSHGDMRLTGGALTTLSVTEDSVPSLIANDRARLAVDGTTSIAGGGRLSLDGAKPVFANGLNLAGELDAGHDSAIAGDLTMSNGQGQVNVNGGGQFTLNGNLLHNGAGFSVTANAGANLLGDVKGSGNFSGGGQINFAGHYQPGNSPASIDFGGDDVGFLSGSVLTLEIGGNTPGIQYDRLTHIDHLDFYGELHLVFADNFVPAIGSSLDLFDFNSFSGSFDANHIFVAGLNDRRLDFSQLISDGRLSITAVPLPPSWLLFGTAIAGLRRFGSHRPMRSAPIGV